MTKKLSTKEQIVEVAGEHFSLHGYDAANLEEIAKACSISKPAIYYHFKDKASLYEAVLLKGFTELAEKILHDTTSDDPATDLLSYIRVFGEYLIAAPTFSAHFSREIANDSKSLPQSCIVELSKTLKRLSEILEEGNQKGIFQCENPFMIQMMIVTTLSAYMTTKTLRKRVSEVLGSEEVRLDPKMDDIIENLSEKILKALTC